MTFLDKLLPTPKFIALAKQTGKSQKWWLEIFIFIAVFYAGSVVESVILAPAMIAWFITSGIIEKILSGAIIDAFDLLSYMPWWLMLVQLYVTIAMTAAAMLFCRLVQKRSFASMGFFKKNWFSEAAAGFLIGAVMISIPFGIGVLTGAVKITGISSDFNLGILFLFLIGFLLQGFGEEVLCRGYFMGSIARKYPLWVAILINSAVFALLHLTNGGLSVLGFVNLLLFGVFASVYMIKRGNIWGIAAIHAAWNFFQGNFYGIKVSGATMGSSVFASEINPSLNIINGGDFGLEGGLAVTLVLIAATVIMLFTKSKNSADTEQPEET